MSNVTQPSDADPIAYVASVENATRRGDAETLLDIYGEVTGETPVMWGPSLIGYGHYDYTYASGHSGRSFKGGFAPRKAKMVLYLMRGLDQYTDLLADLGPHTTGQACLYLGTFAKLDLDVLRTAITQDWKAMTTEYG